LKLNRNIKLVSSGTASQEAGYSKSKFIIKLKDSGLSAFGGSPE
jgi:hypothetical protein